MDSQNTQVRMKTIFHADLRDVDASEDFWLQACGKRYPLIPHTAQSRAAAKSSSTRLAALSDERLTHYTQEAVDLPAERVVRVHIKHSLRNQPDAKGDAGLGNVAIHIPPAAAMQGRHATAETAVHTSIDYVTTAKALVFHHADLINASPDVSSVIYDYMDNDKAISDQFEALGLQMRQMGPPSENSGWSKLVPFTPPASDLKRCDGKNTFYKSQPSPEIMLATGPVMTAMMQVTKNNMDLAGKKWTLQHGTAVQSSASDPEQVRLGRIDAVQGDGWKAALGSTNTAHGLDSKLELVDSSKRQVKLTMNNTYIRYLGAYIRFLDASGAAIKAPHWTIDDPGIVYKALCGMELQYDELRLLGYMQPVNNVMAIPITADPGVLEVTFSFPENAVSAELYGSGLGTGSDPWPKSPVIGGIMTGCLNLAVPAFMLAFGTATQAYKPLYKIVNDLMKNGKFLAAVILGGLAYFGAQFGASAANKKMNWHAFSSLMQVLFDPAATKVLVWVEAQMAAEEAVDEIPFAGWIVLAIDIATGLAQLAETIIEVATSPWNIPNRIATTITTSVNVHPDPRHGAFPQVPAGKAASLVVKMIYQNQSRPTVSVTVPIPEDSTANVLTALFPNNTLGGQVKLEADFYVDAWLAAKATTGIVNNDEADFANIEMYLVQYPVPLDDKSVYIHSSLLTYQNDAYVWQSTAVAPTATVSATNTSSTGNAISVWSGLTLSQRYGMIGLAWKAAGMGITSCANGQGGQLFAMQNLSIPGAAMSDVQFPSCGLDAQTLLVYDPYPPKFLMKDGNWVLGPDGKPQADPNEKPLGEYYVDPRNADSDPLKDGGFHLRKVVLSPPTPFGMGSNQLSYGRFQFQPDSVALHPSGHVIAVSTTLGKIQIGELVMAGAADADVSMARVYAGQAQVPDRPGLLFHPVAVTCAYDGTVLVLEDTKSGTGGIVLARVQAFDLNGNPVNRFVDSHGEPTAFFELSVSGDNTYLDLTAVGDERMTYVYILYYTSDGAQASDYRMSIYQYGTAASVAKPLVTTDSLAAVKIAVDMWHSLYALNYAMVTDGKGNPAGPKSATTGPGGRTVPSVSEWLPPVPES